MRSDVSPGHAVEALCDPIQRRTRRTLLSLVPNRAIIPGTEYQLRCRC